MLGSPRSQMEKMTSSDAKSFPIVGSCVLFGLYVLFKVCPKEYVNALLTTYFVVLGSTPVPGTDTRGHLRPCSTNYGRCWLAGFAVRVSLHRRRFVLLYRDVCARRDFQPNFHKGMFLTPHSAFAG
jgi:hypothetical protein